MRSSCYCLRSSRSQVRCVDAADPGNDGAELSAAGEVQGNVTQCAAFTRGGALAPLLLRRELDFHELHGLARQGEVELQIAG